jgi:ACS family hexuronate transporter-like MFS transporter
VNRRVLFRQEEICSQKMRVQNKRYRWVILGTLFLLHVLTSLGHFSVPTLLPFIKKGWGLSYTQVGLLSASFSIGSAVVAIPAGWAVDSLGIKKIVVLGVILVGTSMLTASWLPSFLWVLGFLILAGVGYSVITPSSNKAMMYWFDEKIRATAMGIKQTGINAGGFLAAFIIPPLALNLNWHYALSIASLIVLIGGIVMLAFYKEFDPQPQQQVFPCKWKHQIKKVFLKRNVMVLSFEGFFRYGVQNAFLTYLILFLWKVIELPVITASFLFGLSHFSGAIGRVTWGLISDRIFGGKRRIVYMCIALFAAILLFLLGHLTSNTPIWSVILIVALLGFTVIGHQGVGLSFVGEVVGKELTGTASGLSQCFYLLGVVLVSPLFGFMVDTFGTYLNAWVSLALLSFIASCLLFFVKEESKSNCVTWFFSEKSLSK